MEKTKTEGTTEGKAGKFHTRDITCIAMCAALLAVCSWIAIPIGDVPVTLQTMGVFLTVGLLGGRRGTGAVLVYILLAAVGVPVLAGFKGGLGALLGNTGGYVLGFLLSALLMWGMERLFGKSLLVLGCSMVFGLLVCYAFGTVWYMYLYTTSKGAIALSTVLGWCVIPFIIPDMVKIAAALTLSARLRRYVQ